MCVIVIKPNGKTLSKDSLDECWRRNGQGAGFVFIPDKIKDGIVTEKGIMTLDALHTKVDKYLHKYGKLIIHFRIQSRGGISAELTHPFPCDYKDKKRFLFHNGTVRLLNTTQTNSDSSLLAKYISVLEDDDAEKLLAKMTKEGYGRFVLVSNRDVKKFADNEAEVQDGIWYSNTKHKTHKGPAPTIGDGANSSADYYDYTEYDAYDGYPRQWRKDLIPAQNPPPIPPNKPYLVSITYFSSAKKAELINSVARAVARVNKIENVDEYCKQIIEDHELEEFTDEQLTKLATFQNKDNPLYEYYAASLT